MPRERNLGQKPSATKNHAATKRSPANAPSSKASPISKSRLAKSALPASSARERKSTSAPPAATIAASRSTKTSAKKSAAAVSDAPTKKRAKARKNPSSSDAHAKKARRLKPMKLDAAMRHHGFDEHKLARSAVGLLDDFEKRKNERKLHLDLLKEGFKIFSVPRPADRPIIAEGPVPVVLMHSVPRPVRDTSAHAPEEGLSS